jgi:radical SAM protein with 4Fe4S-binding SPASM domain
MTNLRYEFAKLRNDFYLGGIQERYRAGKSLPPPGYVIWDCTRRCNLTCLHCGAVKETYTRELSTEQIEGFVDQFAAMKVGMFAVTGGEPLLRRDLSDILFHAQRRGLKTGIATNGFLVDQGAAEWIKAAGVHSVQVSLDGPETTHNRIRGNEQSYQRAVQAIELLNRLKVAVVSVATTVTRNNFPDLDELRQLLSRLGVRLWRLAVVMPIGRAHETNICPDMDQLSWLLEYVKQYDSRELHIYFGENLTFLGEWEKKVRNGPVVCPIGYTACCVGVDGNVRGCPEQSDTFENREGSLLDTSFQEIWQKGFGRYRNREILVTDPKCACCRSKDDCFGGCWVMRAERLHCIYEMIHQPAQAGGASRETGSRNQPGEIKLNR